MHEQNHSPDPVCPIPTLSTPRGNPPEAMTPQTLGIDLSYITSSGGKEERKIMRMFKINLLNWQNTDQQIYNTHTHCRRLCLMKWDRFVNLQIPINWWQFLFESLLRQANISWTNKPDCTPKIPVTTALSELYGLMQCNMPWSSVLFFGFSRLEGVTYSSHKTFKHHTHRYTDRYLRQQQKSMTSFLTEGKISPEVLQWPCCSLSEDSRYKCLASPPQVNENTD